MNRCSASTVPRSDDGRSYSRPVTQRFASPLGPRTPGVKPAGLSVPAPPPHHLRARTRPSVAFIGVFDAESRARARLNSSRHGTGRSGRSALLQPGFGGFERLRLGPPGHELPRTPQQTLPGQGGLRKRHKELLVLPDGGHADGLGSARAETRPKPAAESRSERAGVSLAEGTGYLAAAAPSFPACVC